MKPSSSPSSPPPLVSVVVPCYNAEPFVAETIESVLAQTYPAVELIVVDDHSTDGSWEVIQRYADRLTALRLPENRKGGYARNRGVERASGEFLMFLDADDVIAPDTLEAMVTRLRSENLAVAACPWQRLEWSDGEWKVGPPEVPLPVDEEDHLAGWLKRRWVPTCAVLWRRDAYELTGGWDEALTVNQDGDIMMRALADGVRLVFAQGGTAYYRRFTSDRLSVSGNVYTEGRFQAWMRVLDKLAAQLDRRGKLPTYAPLIGTLYNQLALDALQYGYPEVGRELAGRGTALVGHQAVSSNPIGRLLVRVLGLEGKERIATALARVGIASPARREVVERLKERGHTGGTER